MNLLPRTNRSFHRSEGEYVRNAYILKRFHIKHHQAVSLSLPLNRRSLKNSWLLAEFPSVCQNSWNKRHSSSMNSSDVQILHIVLWYLNTYVAVRSRSTSRVWFSVCVLRAEVGIPVHRVYIEEHGPACIGHVCNMDTSLLSTS